MRKIISLLLILSLSFTFASCGKSNDATQNTENTKTQTEVSTEAPITNDAVVPEDIVISDTDETTDVIEIVEDEEYYKITRCGFMFSYSLYDKDKNVVKTVENIGRYPRIEMVDDMIVRVYIQAGTGITTRSTYYYDVENNRFSESYISVFDYCNGLLVHADHDKVIVRSAFDNSFYQEFTDFSAPFSPVAFPFVDINFVEDGQSISVTYHSGDDYTEVTEIFDIN